MCAYCMVGDHTFRHDPPWDYWRETPNPHPLVPKPVKPQRGIEPWSIERLKEYRDLLLQIKELEDRLGCPCEPNKADYLTILKERIAQLEGKLEWSKGYV